MNQENIENYIQTFLSEKRKGMSYSDIRKKLQAEQLEEYDIKFIIASIDREIIGDKMRKSQNQGAIELILIGAFTTVLGLVLTLGTYLDLFNLGDLMIFAYGPVFGGLTILSLGLRNYRRGIKNKSE